MRPLWARALAALVLMTALAGCLQPANDEKDDDREDEDERVAPAPPGITWGDPATATIRPGSSLGGYCTFNWLFTDAAGTAYIGTAAHCTELRERVALGEGEAIGTVVFDSDETRGADPLVDFALVQLDADVVGLAHPQMLEHDGPTGVATDVKIGDLVAIHGHGTLLGGQDSTRSRPGIIVWVTETEYRANMPAVWGDSGAPILQTGTGAALGIVSRFGIEPPLPTTDVGPLMSWVLEELQAAGFAVTLATV